MTKHSNPTPTTDVILQKGSAILLIRRKKDPFKDHLALPGGFVEEGETVEESAKRETFEETALEIEPIQILGVYSDPSRDPRGHMMTVVFVGTIINGEPVAGSDSGAVEWVDLNDIENKQIAFDHRKIIQDYKEWKRTDGTFWSTKKR